MLSAVFVILLVVWFLALAATGFGGLIHFILAYRNDSGSKSAPLPPD